MRFKPFGLVLALLSVAAFPLFAANNQAGAYVGVDGGWAVPAHSPSPAHYSNANQNYTYGGTLGYHMALGRNVATGVEANYNNFGQNSYAGDATTNNANGSFKNSAIQILLTGTYLMDNGFNTFLKIGAAREQTTLDLTNTTTGVSQWIPAVAAGLGYELVKNFNFYAQYERTFGSDWGNATSSSAPDDPVSLNILTMGVNYTLPM